MKLDVIYNEDCLVGMQRLPDNSVDMILCDLPYGTTACRWDIVVPFEPLWEQYKRVATKNAAIILTASQPFTSALVNSNVNHAKHFWVWLKERGTGFQVAKYRPMMAAEDVCVFVNGSGRLKSYNPQMLLLEKPRLERYASSRSESSPIKHIREGGRIVTERYPLNVLRFSRDTNRLHPTQKPVALFEYMIRTYSDEGEVVLDNCIGSGTTAVACLNTGRHYIGFEKDPEYFQIAKERIRTARAKRPRVALACAA